MKPVIITLAVAALTAIPLNAQSIKETKQQTKERMELRKIARKELNEKTAKDARKQAKAYTKQGWQVAPGDLPIDKQLDRAYLLQYEMDEEAQAKFIHAEAISIGENYDAASLQAVELAKQKLAGQMETEITALIKNQVSNQQLEAEEAASATKTVSSSMNLISQSLGAVTPVVKLYRTLKNKNKEVLVRIFYSRNSARAAAKKVVRKQLEKESEQLGQKLEKLLGW